MSDHPSPSPPAPGPADAPPVEPRAGGVTLTLTRDDRVAVVGLARPEVLNAQTPATWAALAAVRDTLPATVRVVVVRGAGRAFSAGLDRRLLAGGDGPNGPAGPDGGSAALAAGTPAAVDARIAGFQAAFDWLQTGPWTSVAVVQGHAIGAGFQLALACDLRLVADDVAFCMAEAALGLVPDLGGTQRLVDLIGYGRAVDLCLTARRVGAEEALRLGLATAVVPVAALDDAVEPLLDALLAVPRESAAATKALLLAATGDRHAAQQARERAAQRERLTALAAQVGQRGPG